MYSYHPSSPLQINTHPNAYYPKEVVLPHHSLSPFPSPTSSTSSATYVKCQLHRNSITSPSKITAKSWETMKSPAASFLATFAPASHPVEEQEGDEIDDYVIDSFLGYGGFATVRKGYRISDGEKVAIKIIKKEKMGDQRLEREISIWKLLNHPHIVQLEKVLDTDDATYLVNQYCEGNLLRHLQQPMPEHQTRTLFRQICLAVQYLHEQVKVCHKDLKLENILLDQHGHIKLCDFGLSIFQHPTASLDTLDCAGGSLAYVAPEQIRSDKSLPTPSSDIWSLGVILYAMAVGKLPFADNYELRLQQKVLNGQYTMPDHLSPSLQDLIQGCLTIDPQQRYDIQQILQHPFFHL